MRLIPLYVIFKKRFFEHTDMLIKINEIYYEKRIYYDKSTAKVKLGPKVHFLKKKNQHFIQEIWVDKEWNIL